VQGFLLLIRVRSSSEVTLQGINMPARTSAFIGDSIYLNPMTYHQMSGRAGRRGYDLQGNVVFVGVPLERIASLAAARIPDAMGKFLLSQPCILRLTGLVMAPLQAGHTAKHREVVARSIRAMINFPLASIVMSAGARKSCNAHYLLFSLAMLQARGLIDESCAPFGLAPLVNRIDYYENAAALFLVDLLQTGALQAAIEGMAKESAAVKVLQVPVPDLS
jgi:ATP-dependent RNA helicase DDX60